MPPTEGKSETPLTDAEYAGYGEVAVSFPGYFHKATEHTPYVRADFARYLERKLAEAEKEAARYRFLRDDELTFAVMRPRISGHIAYLGQALDAFIDAARATETGGER